MRALSFFAAVLVPVTYVASAPANSPQTSTTVLREPQAIAVLQQSVAAMGGSVPADSRATGIVTTVAGSLTENGTVTILTRGVNQSSVSMQTSHGFTLVYSNGEASLNSIGTTKPLPLERAVTSQAVEFPLPLLDAALANFDMSYTYVGLEMISGSLAHHVRFWNSFAAEQDFASLAPLSVRDIWIDLNSFLPLRISYKIQDAQGPSVPTFAIDVYFSDYRNVGGFKYPFMTNQSFDGTPWATVLLESVSFNVGLTDADFQIH